MAPRLRSMWPDGIEVCHAQVITMGESYTMPFYSGIKEGGVVIINSDAPLLSDEDVERLKDLNVAVFYINGTQIALDVAGWDRSVSCPSHHDGGELYDAVLFGDQGGRRRDHQLGRPAPVRRRCRAAERPQRRGFLHQWHPDCARCGRMGSKCVMPKSSRWGRAIRCRSIRGSRRAAS